MNSQGTASARPAPRSASARGAAKAALSAAPSSSGLRARRPAAPKLSAYLTKSGLARSQAISRLPKSLLLDAPHIAEGAVGEHHGDQRNAVAHGGGEFVAGVEEAAVAADREHRHVGPRVLRAERGGKAPAEIVLIAGREKRARLVDRKGEAGGKADLRDFVDIDAVLRQFGADRVEEGELRRELCQTLRAIWPGAPAFRRGARRGAN